MEVSEMIFNLKVDGVPGITCYIEELNVHLARICGNLGIKLSPHRNFQIYDIYMQDITNCFFYSETQIVKVDEARIMAIKSAKELAPMTELEQTIERYREHLDPFQREIICQVRAGDLEQALRYLAAYIAEKKKSTPEGVPPESPWY